MAEQTFTQTIQTIGNSRYLRVPIGYIRHGPLESGKQYRVTLTPVEEGEEHEPQAAKANA